MTAMLLGETAEFWIKVRAAMRKANIETVQDLEDRLSVTPPIYSMRPSEIDDRWVIISRRPKFDAETVVGWGATKTDAEQILFAMQRAAA